MLKAWRKDLWAAGIIFCLGLALGLAVNAFSPKGFDFRMAAGLKQAWQPPADWAEDTPTALATPGVKP
jgi:hypothetical protein